MANAGQQFQKQLSLEHWREVLPGVPDDQIVLPRYNACGLGFPVSPHGTDKPELWRSIQHWLHFVVRTNHMPGSGRSEQTRRLVRNIFARAERWWDSLGEPTTLMLNQKLYVHRNSWKHIWDMKEFFVCWSLCIAWLNLPLPERSAKAAKMKVRTFLREMIKSVEMGKPPPDVRPRS